MNNKFNIIAQAFYGNKVATSIREDELDHIVLGYTGNDIPITEKIDRTIVKVPNTDNIFIVYNKYEEEKMIGYDYDKNPLAIIPENDIKIYSRCIVCKMNEDGGLENLNTNDYDKFMKYLAD